LFSFNDIWASVGAGLAPAFSKCFLAGANQAPTGF